MEPATFSPRSATKSARRTKCVVKDCESRPIKNPSIRFHKLPTPNEQCVLVSDYFGNVKKVDKLEAWKNALKIEEVTPSMVVCSLHFKKDDYNFPDVVAKTRRLKKNAVPSCNLPNTYKKVDIIAKKARFDRNNRRNNNKNMQLNQVSTKEESETVEKLDPTESVCERPLIKCSLVKEAIPSIFEKDLDDQTIAKKKRKRRSVIPNYPEGLNNTGNFTIDSDGNLSINYSPILVTFNDNQNNALQFNVTTNNSESTLVPAISKSTDQNYENIGNNINGILNAANYYVNGHVNTYSNSFDNMSHIRSDQEKYEGTLEVGDQDKTITIYINKPTQEINESNVNNIENTKTSETLQSTGTSVIQKEQVSQRIPSQFNNISELSLAPPKEVTIIVPNDEIIVLNESNNYAFNNDNTQKTMQPNKGTIHYPLPESNIQMNIRSFDLIFHNSHKIKLPNAMWGYHKNSIDKDIIIFSKAKWFKSNVLIPPIYEKQVIFHESDNIKIYINNKFSPVEVRRPRDISEMEQILQGVDETVVCSGGPSIGDCDTAQCAQKDYAVNRWRHKLCPIIVTADETTCKFCVTINQVLRYPKKKKLPFGRRPRPEKQQKEEAS